MRRPRTHAPVPQLTPNQWRAARDVSLFVIGLVGVIHEAFFTPYDRPGLLFLFSAMMGLPAVLWQGYDRKDEK